MQQQLPLPLLMPFATGGYLPTTQAMPPQQAQHFAGARMGGPDAFFPLTAQQLQHLQANMGAMGGNVVVGGPSVTVGGHPPQHPSPKPGAKPQAKPGANQFMGTQGGSTFHSPPQPPPPPAKESEGDGREGGNYSDPMISGLMQLMAKNGWRVEVRPNDGNEGASADNSGKPGGSQAAVHGHAPPPSQPQQQAQAQAQQPHPPQQQQQHQQQQQGGMPAMFQPTPMKPASGATAPAPKRGGTPQQHTQQAPPPPPFQLPFNLPQSDAARGAPNKAPAGKAPQRHDTPPPQQPQQQQQQQQQPPAPAQLSMSDLALMEAARSGWTMDMMRNLGFGGGFGNLGFDSDSSDAPKGDPFSRPAQPNAWMSSPDPPSLYGHSAPQRQPTPSSLSAQGTGKPRSTSDAKRDPPKPNQIQRPPNSVPPPPPPPGPQPPQPQNHQQQQHQQHQVAGAPMMMHGAGMGSMMQHQQLPSGNGQPSPLLPGSPLWGGHVGIPPGAIVINQTGPVVMPQANRGSRGSTPKSGSQPKKSPAFPQVPSSPFSGQGAFAGQTPIHNPFGEIMAEDLLSVLPKHVVDAVTKDPQSLQPELYREIMQAMQMVSQKSAGDPEPAASTEGATQVDEAEVEPAPRTPGPVLYTAKRADGNGKQRGSGAGSKLQLPDLRASRDELDSPVRVEGGSFAGCPGGGGSFAENSPTLPRGSRDDLFGVDPGDAAGGEKGPAAGFTPTRGKYKMALKMSQPLGIVQCSLPGGSKGFGAGRGKSLSE